jgi:hypothetical protein
MRLLRRRRSVIRALRKGTTPFEQDTTVKLSMSHAFCTASVRPTKAVRPRGTQNVHRAAMDYDNLKMPTSLVLHARA